MMSRTLKVAAVGAGWVTEARHIPALLGSGRCQVVGIIDKHGERAEAVAGQLKLEGYFEQFPPMRTSLLTDPAGGPESQD